LNITLWIFQAVLSFFFLMHSRILLMPDKAIRDSMREQMQFIFDLPAGLRMFIGVAEILAPIGLIAPGLTGIWPWLTPLAAAGLAVIMLGSIVYHVSRGEASPRLMLNVVVLALAAFVAYGRWVILPL